MNNKASKRYFTIFKEEFMLWVCEFGVLKGWEIEFEYCETDTKVDDNPLAEVRCHNEDRLVFVSFYENWHDNHVTNYCVRKTAFHEALEVLFEPLEHLVKKSCTKQARTEVHTLIKVMENTLFNNNYIKRFGKIDEEYFNHSTLNDIIRKNKKGGK